MTLNLLIVQQQLIKTTLAVFLKLAVKLITS